MNKIREKIFNLIFLSSSAIVALITEKSIEAMRRKRVMDSTLKEANNESEGEKNEEYH